MPVILSSVFGILAHDSQFILRIKKAEASVSYASKSFSSKSAGKEDITPLNWSTTVLGSPSSVNCTMMLCFLRDDERLRLWNDKLARPTSLNGKAMTEPPKWWSLAFGARGGLLSWSSWSILGTVARGVPERCSRRAAAAKRRVKVIPAVLDLAVSWRPHAANTWHVLLTFPRTPEA